MKRSALSLFVFTFAITPFVNADTFGSGDNQFEIPFVTIGDPANAADTTGAPNPAGSVGYTYRIGKYEIPEQAIRKANILSGLDGNPLGLTLDDRGSQKPATSISWYEAARFVNWLNEEKGTTPAYKFDTNGDFQLWEPFDPGYNPSNRFRNSQAQYFLPSADEWYKAAYYDPDAGLYYRYPTGSNDIPDGIDFPGDTEFEAVYWDGTGNLVPNDITDVGVESPYGTLGQGGNVFEWEESESDLLNDSSLSPRAIRGGFWQRDIRLMDSNLRINSPPTNENEFNGFRIASLTVPEPSSFVILALAISTSCLCKQRV